MFPVPFDIIIEIVPLVTDLLYLKSLKKSILFFLLLLLCLTAITELTGRYLIHVLHKPNAWLYNIFMSVEFIVYAYIFYKTYVALIYKRIVRLFICAFPVLVFLNIVFFQGLRLFDSYTAGLGSFCIILFSCFYFYDLLQQKEKLNLLKTPMFWFSIGILFFYSGDIIFTLFSNLAIRSRIQYWSFFRDKLIILLYTCFTLVFICSKPETRRSLI